MSAKIGGIVLNLAADVLLSPAGFAALAFLLCLSGDRGRRLGAALLALVVLLGLPFVSAALLNSLAPGPAAPGPTPEAIVILSADAVRVEDTPDLEPGPLTLDRLRGGAALFRRTGAPILVSGGPLEQAQTTLAGMMVDSLERDFRVPVRWAEAMSVDTWQNARFSAGILKSAGVGRVYLVTHSWHMRRAMLAFRHFGLDPVPVPVRPPGWPVLSWRMLFVGPSAWLDSYFALHEWVGLAYYSLRQ